MGPGHRAASRPRPRRWRPLAGERADAIGDGCALESGGQAGAGTSRVRTITSVTNPIKTAADQASASVSVSPRNRRLRLSLVVMSQTRPTNVTPSGGWRSRKVTIMDDTAMIGWRRSNASLVVGLGLHAWDLPGAAGCGDG